MHDANDRGLSFPTTQGGLRNAFQNFGKLVDGENSECCVVYLFLETLH